MLIVLVAFSSVVRALLSVSGAPLDADGCEAMYIDLGSNIGVQPRAFFEPERYADNYAQAQFNAIFGEGASRRRHACVFGFEPNPAHLPRLREIEGCYRSLGWRLQFFHAAALDEEGTVELFSDASDHEHHWGSGISDALVRDRSGKGMTTDAVPSINIAAWLDDLLATHRPERVFLKMDIEGSEYVVLPPMHERGLLCMNRVHAMDIEWHDVVRQTLSAEVQANWATFVGAGSIAVVQGPQVQVAFPNQSCGQGTFVLPFSTADQLHDHVELPCARGSATASSEPVRSWRPADDAQSRGGSGSCGR